MPANSATRCTRCGGPSLLGQDRILEQLEEFARDADCMLESNSRAIRKFAAQLKAGECAICFARPGVKQGRRCEHCGAGTRGPAVKCGMCGRSFVEAA